MDDEEDEELELEDWNELEAAEELVVARDGTDAEPADLAADRAQQLLERAGTSDGDTDASQDEEMFLRGAGSETESGESPLRVSVACTHSRIQLVSRRLSAVTYSISQEGWTPSPCQAVVLKYQVTRCCLSVSVPAHGQPGSLLWHKRQPLSLTPAVYKTWLAALASPCHCTEAAEEEQGLAQGRLDERSDSAADEDSSEEDNRESGDEGDGHEEGEDGAHPSKGPQLFGSNIEAQEILQVQLLPAQAVHQHPLPAACLPRL